MEEQRKKFEFEKLKFLEKQRENNEKKEENIQKILVSNFTNQSVKMRN